MTLIRSPGQERPAAGTGTAAIEVPTAGMPGLAAGSFWTPGMASCADCWQTAHDTAWGKELIWWRLVGRASARSPSVIRHL